MEPALHPPKRPASVEARIVPTLSVVEPIQKALTLAESVLVASDALKQLRAAQPGRLLIVGIGGPTGAGKTTLARKVCSMFSGSRVVSMRNYFRRKAPGRRGGGKGRAQIYCDRNSNPASFDIALLCQHLAALQRGESVEAPSFEFQGGQYGQETLAPPPSGLLIVEGVCALDAALRSLYSLSVFVVGGLYFDLLRRVQSDIGDTRFDASDIFPGIRQFVEASWKHAQLRVRNEVDSSFAERENQLYMLKVPLKPGQSAPTAEEIARMLDSDAWTVQEATYVDWFMAAPSSEEAAASERPQADLKCRLLGGKCFITPERFWVVEPPFIISPESGEFEVETATVGGMKRLGYRIAVSYKQHTVTFSDSVRGVSVCVDNVDNEVGTFIRIKGFDKAAVRDAAEALGVWDMAACETRSYYSMVLASGPPRASTPASILDSTDLSTTYSSRSISVLELLGLSELLSDTDTEAGGDDGEEDVGGGSTEEVDTAADDDDDDDDEQSDEEKRAEREETQALMNTSSEGGTAGANDAAAVASGSTPVLSFEKGLFAAVGVIQKLRAESDDVSPQPIVILIGGPMGSGKSSLAARLAEVFTPADQPDLHTRAKGDRDRTQIPATNSCDLRLDDFINPDCLADRDSTDSIDEDDLAAIDLLLLRETLKGIVAKASSTTSAKEEGDGAPAVLALPRFNFRTRKREWVVGADPMRQEARIMFVTGVHALQEEVVACCEGFRMARIAVSGGQKNHLVQKVIEELEIAGVAAEKRQESMVREMIFPDDRSIAATLKRADVKILNDFDPLWPILDSASYTLKSTTTKNAADIKARLFDDQLHAVQHWIERTTDVYLSPPGRPHVQPGHPSAVRIRQFNGKYRMMLRNYIDEGDFIVCPAAELRVSLRQIRGLLRAGFTVAGLLEIHSEVVRVPDGLTVSVDTLPQMGVRMMQLMHSDKSAVSHAAKLLDCGPHSFVRESYPAYIMGRWKPGIHRPARSCVRSHPFGSALDRLLADALAPHFAKVQRIERSCSPTGAGAEAESDGEQAGQEPAVSAAAAADAAEAAVSAAMAAAERERARLLELELQALKESSDTAKAEAECWRISANRWRGGVFLLVSLVAVLLLRRRFRRP